MPWFRKHHTCPCGTDWRDEWDCFYNDRCPTCDVKIEPDEHEAIQGAKSAKTQNPPIPRGYLPPGAIKGFDKQRVSLWFQDAGLLEHVDVALIDSAAREIDMAAYVLTDWPVMQALTRAADRGVKVRIYLDGNSACRARAREGF
jgi:phosphatidylserine/phosphatidylglycerophosphate/cardiolipin synthase-like enzyme